MCNLKRELRERMDGDRSLAMTLAKVAGYSNPTPIYKFVNQPKREFHSFATLLKVVETAFPKRVIELMGSYIPTLDVNGKNARYALEYTAVELKEAHPEHIERMLQATTSESILWAHYYQTSVLLSRNKSAATQFITPLSKLSTPTEETYALKYIIMAYVLAFKREHALFTEYTKLAYRSTSKIDDEFLAASFKMRIFVLLSVSYLQSNNPKMARKYLLKVKNPTRPTVNAWILLHLGNTYVFSNYNEAEAHYVKAIQMKGITKKILVQNKLHINFLYAYWGIDKHYPLDLSVCGNLVSYICHLISVGKYEEAEKSIQSVDLSELSDIEQSKLHYFQSKMTGNNDYIYQAITGLKRSNEWHFRSIILKELEGLNPYLKKALEV